MINLLSRWRYLLQRFWHCLSHCLLHRLSQTCQLARSSIKRRVVFLTVVPLLIMAVVLTGYFSVTRIMDESRRLQLHGEKYSDLIARSAEFGFFSRDKQVLTSLGNSLLQDDEVATVAFVGVDREVIAQVGVALPKAYLTPLLPTMSGDPRVGAPAQNKLGRYRYFVAPVYDTADSYNLNQELLPVTQGAVDTISDESLPVNKLPASRPVSAAGTAVGDFAGSTDELMGWVIVAIDEHVSMDRRRQILLASILVALFGLLLTLTLAVSFGQRISQPIQHMSGVLDRIREGDLDARVDTESDGELGAMAQGINQLAAASKLRRSAMEQEIEQATQRLTSALKALEQHNQELEQAREAALNASRAKDVFLASMSHELRTPLTSIIGFVNLQLETLQTEDQREYSEIIKQSSALMLAEIDDILELSRIESGIVEITEAKFDLEKYLESVIAMHTFSAFKKGLELVLFIESDVPRQLRSDAARIRQVVNILISNAIKFTARGEVVLLVSLASQSSDQATINFLVKDSGEGIAEDHMDRLFQPFSQADVSVQHRHGGTGLGLYIAKRIVTLLGGVIEVDSQPGVGTEVNFSVVCAVQAESQATDSIGQRQPEAIPVLIYERNSWARRAIRNQLLNYSVELYTSAELGKALQLLSHGTPSYSLVVLGLSHDDVLNDSLAATVQQVRRSYSGAVAVLSPDPHLNALMPIGQVLANEPILFLRKPLRREKLDECMHQLLGSARWQGPHMPRQATAALYSAISGLQGKRVLVVEDNEFNQTLITRMLKTRGAEVANARDGIDAGARCQSRLFDMILMDVQMPQMNGLEATRAIRQGTGVNRNTPIIALTANVIETEKAQLFAAGVNDILYKPIVEDEFYASIARCLTLDRPGLVQPDSATISANDPALVTEIRRLLDTLTSALKTGAKDDLRRYAHDLKGLAGMLAQPAIGQLAVALHQASLSHERQGNTKGNIQQTEQQIEQLVRQIEALLG